MPHCWIYLFPEDLKEFHRLYLLFLHTVHSGQEVIREDRADIHLL